MGRNFKLKKQEMKNATKSASKPTKEKAGFEKKEYKQSKPKKVKEEKAFISKKHEHDNKAAEDDDEPKLPNGRPQPLAKNIKIATATVFKSTPTVCLDLLKLDDVGLMSRLLYPNPVCFLSTTDQSKHNVMTLSWLAPCNNYGGFSFTIHKSRYTCEALLAHKNASFVLSIPTAAQIELILAVGKCSGKTVDKFGADSTTDTAIISNLSTIPVGTYTTIENMKKHNKQHGNNSNSNSNISLKLVDKTDVMSKVSVQINKASNSFLALNNDSDSDSDGDDEKNSDPVDDGVSSPPGKNNSNISNSSNIDTTVGTKLMAVEGTVAHILCKVISHTDSADAGHHLFIAQMVDAYVHTDYWSNKGKCFVASNANLPPLVSFLGSQKFAYISEPSTTSTSDE